MDMTLERNLPLDQNDNAAQVFMLGNLGAQVATDSNSSVFSNTEQQIVLICNNSGSTTFVAGVPFGVTTSITVSNGATLPTGSCQAFGVPAGYVIRNGAGGAIMVMENFAGTGS